MYIEGTSGLWEYVIGLEVHAQIESKTKLFSSSGTTFGAVPNSQVSLIDAAFPGTLPVLNMVCVEKAVRACFGINANVSLVSSFDRKHYFYPDLPRGYQISQFYYPIGRDGWIDIKSQKGNVRRITIDRLHLEQDAGKNVHDMEEFDTCIDLNRAGVALMEIVSNHDIRSPFEAGEYLKKLRSILRCVGSSSGDMEKGAMRCDANVSVKRVGDETLGVKCEIKNLNSIKHVVKALEYEGKAQVRCIEEGQKVRQSTMLFLPDTCQTKVMRYKEDSQDYKYFPDPDLPPVLLSLDYIEGVKASVPELPHEKSKRYMSDFGLCETDAEILSSDIYVANYFESVVRQNAPPKIASNWIISYLFSLCNEADIEISNSKVTPSSLAEVISLLQQEYISSKSAKTVLGHIFVHGGNPKDVVDKLNLAQVIDVDLIRKWVKCVLIREHDTAVAYNNGRHKVFNFLVSQVFKESKGRASPSLVQSVLLEELKNIKI
ncbi:Asp-tRNA(Asn)/Glu-tRNA(Gln) amidotransferase subunit GatB [Candidatus Sneabacter namystus]|uniref:Aspartyl/glutamyl-tRNA(Asn/Gln) amidotransferase subunit B n=1 Tax=Candidatus Sneabacter namystus TaxID=2601646 RepID=A0A5C0UHH6_9RICK|nr:Asp-tRNA(Asn)/Glu-tRNA(Gln) amidotransferase subunit GatB [Candidatus Sneabacter namystus]QEK39578.1 Asp-tRNA(Asn)/Glu-tRNA(Gln) amidotransferase subunit GatB [Candidatus Sneabacter namystus]